MGSPLELMNERLTKSASVGSRGNCSQKDPPDCRPTYGRLSGQDDLFSPTGQVFNDLPRVWFFGVSHKVS